RKAFKQIVQLDILACGRQGRHWTILFVQSVLDVAKDWENGNASVGDARKASLEAISVANESSNQTSIAVARSVGHAVATAHMADHSLIAAQYALKDLKNEVKSEEAERKWQNEQLSIEIKELILSARANN
ncbi:MAG: hypothetical protein GZ091_01065, partial [Paludibacter sp.]|nr:hypothetical protein [Paludibacter sp.]